MQRQLLGTISVDFDVTGQLLIIILHSSNTWEKTDVVEKIISTLQGMY